MVTSVKIFLSLLIILGLLGINFNSGQLVLVAPRLSHPTIGLPGEQVELRVRHALPIALGEWRILLNNAAKQAFPLSVIESSRYFGESILRIKIPMRIPVGSYTLSIGYGNKSIIEPKAIHVVAAYSKDVSFIQLADLPTLGGDGAGDQKLKIIIDEINIINPSAVLLTGDVAYGGSWDQYNRLRALLETIEVPVIVAPGNHAYYGWAGFLTRIGEPYHITRLGQFSIISLNSGHGRDQITMSQLDWLKQSMRQLPNTTSLLQLHHPIHHRNDLSGFLRANVDRLLNFIAEQDVSLILSGHWHGDSVYDQTGRDRTDTWQFPGPPFVVTTTAGSDFRPAYSSSPLHYGYRYIRYVNGELESYTYDYDGDGERDAASSIPLGKLSVQANGRYGVVVNNGLNEGFKNAKVRITLPDSEHEYRPNQGKIENVVKRKGQSQYDILIDLPANKKTKLFMVQEGFNE